MIFTDLNGDQRREMVNSRQRFIALREAEARARADRGSMAWAEVRGHTYLVKADYDSAGRRRQRSLGPRSPETEVIKTAFEEARNRTAERVTELRRAVSRQSAVNRALGLGRVPLVVGKILRILDEAGLLGAGLRVIGTNAIYAYEAASGVFVDASLAATMDVDLLFDSRRVLRLAGPAQAEGGSMLNLLRRVDRSFERAAQSYRAVNREGFLVDFVQPLRQPPWNATPKLTEASGDLEAVEIEGLDWLENAPAFEAVAIDERGTPVRIVAPDPRVWTAHKLWVSRREDRAPVQRRRDADQAHAVAELITEHLTYLEFDPHRLTILPADVVAAALPLFARRDD